MMKDDLKITTEYNNKEDMVADIRNKMTPLKQYFTMLRDIEKISTNTDLKEKLLVILGNERDKCVPCIEYIEDVLEKIMGL